MRSLLTFLFFTVTITVCAQQQVEHAPEYSQFPQGLSLINPAAYTEPFKYRFLIGHQGYLGAFKYNSYYFNAAAQFGEEKRKHIWGLYFHQEQGSKYLQRKRLYLQYALHFNISEKVKAGAGLSVGFFNYQVNALQTVAAFASSVYSADGNIGLWLTDGKSFGGLSILQVPEGQLTPYKEVLILPRAYQLLAGRTFVISPNLEASSIISLKSSSQDKLDGKLYVSFLMDNKIMAGINWHYSRSITVMAGLEQLMINNEAFSVIFAYNFPSSAFKISTINTYEITLRLHINKRENEGLHLQDTD